MKPFVLLALVLLAPIAQAEICWDDGSKFNVDACRQAFSIKAHPKAKGTDFTISYPIGWKAEEGERPNVVQKFTSDDGTGLETVIVMTLDMRDANGKSPSKRDIDAILNPANGRQQIPDGSKFVSAERISVEGDPALAIEFVQKSDRAGIALMTQTWSVFFVQGTTLVQVMCMVAGSPDADEAWIGARMAQFKPLFKLMVNSIVIPGKWSKQPVAEAASLNGESVRSEHGWQWKANQAGILLEIIGAAVLVSAAYRSRSAIKNIEETWKAELATKLRDIVAGQARTELAGFVLLAVGLAAQMAAAF